MTVSTPAHGPTGVAAAGSWRHVPALDGLRGLAVIAVLLFHDGRLDGGFLGVDLFFALSGFLITGLLVAERADTGTVHLGSFWARRARRLLPAMLVFLVAIVPIAWLLGSPAQLEDARDSVIPSLLYVTNWHQIRESADYWALFSDPSLTTHLWSLAVEEQFYVVWPLVVALVARRRRWRGLLAGVTAAGAVLSGVLMALLHVPGDPTRAYIGTDTRMASMLMGALVAIVGVPEAVQRAAQRSGRAVGVMQLLAVTAIGLAWWTADGSDQWLFEGGMVAYAVIAALLCASVGLERATLVQRVVSAGILRWFGRLSYGLYLWHWPVFVLLDADRTGLDGVARSAVCWAVSIVLAVISLRMVEQPIRADRHRWTTVRTRVGAAVAIAAAVVVAAVVPGRASGPAAFDPTSIWVSTTESSDRPVPTSPGASVDTTVAASRPRVASMHWQGDSVAYDAAPGVLAAVQASGIQAFETTIPGLGLVESPAADPIDIYESRLAESEADVVVFMFSTWDSSFSTVQQQAAFDRYTTMVLGTGARLVFVTPPPVEPSVTQDYEEMLGFAVALAARDPERVTVLDAASLWGEYRRDLDDDGVPDRKRDGLHLCPQGAAVLGNWLVVRLTGLFDGLAPAPPAGWAAGSWTEDPRYSQPAGTCS